MSVIVIPIDASGPSAEVKNAVVRVDDTIRWTVSPDAARATITFQFPSLVRMMEETASRDQPAEAVVVSKPGQNESLKYDVVVSAPAWPVPKPATAELIFAVEMIGHSGNSAA